jgi:hypothetical protein
MMVCELVGLQLLGIEHNMRCASGDPVTRTAAQSHSPGVCKLTA